MEVPLVRPAKQSPESDGVRTFQLCARPPVALPFAAITRCRRSPGSSRGSSTVGSGSRSSPPSHHTCRFHLGTSCRGRSTPRCSYTPRLSALCSRSRAPWLCPNNTVWRTAPEYPCPRRPRTYPTRTVRCSNRRESSTPGSPSHSTYPFPNTRARCNTLLAKRSSHRPSSTPRSCPARTRSSNTRSQRGTARRRPCSHRNKRQPHRLRCSSRRTSRSSCPRACTLERRRHRWHLRTRSRLCPQHRPCLR